MAILGTVGDSTSLTMTPLLITFIGLVFHFPIFLLLNKTVCCGIFVWAAPIFNTCNIYLLIFSLKLIFLSYLMMYVFVLNNIRSLLFQPYKPTHPFTLIHSDIWEPSKVTISSGKRWFVTFIDDHNHLTWVFLLSRPYKPNHPFTLTHSDAWEPSKVTISSGNFGM